MTIMSGTQDALDRAVLEHLFGDPVALVTDRVVTACSRGSLVIAGRGGDGVVALVQGARH